MCICLQKFRYKLNFNCTWMVLLSMAFSKLGLGQSAESIAYDNMIEDERMVYTTSHFAEEIASGVAALTIGLYGYYYDDRGIALRLAYAGTQTIGVLLIGDAIYQNNRISLLLKTNEHLIKIDQGQSSTGALRKDLAKATSQNKLALSKKIAYSSTILSAIYLLNSESESDGNQSIKNIYRFFAFNAALVSIASFYEIYGPSSNISLEPSVFNNSVHYSLAWTYNF